MYPCTPLKSLSLALKLRDQGLGRTKLDASSTSLTYRTQFKPSKSSKLEQTHSYADVELVQMNCHWIRMYSRSYLTRSKYRIVNFCLNNEVFKTNEISQSKTSSALHPPLSNPAQSSNHLALILFSISMIVTRPVPASQAPKPLEPYPPFAAIHCHSLVHYSHLRVLKNLLSCTQS